MSKSISLGGVLLIVAAGLPGCAFDLLNRWDGPVVRSHLVSAPTDAVWQELNRELPAAGLLVAGVSDQEHIIDFSWVTAAGDGRQYLDCDAESVGSASIRPRIALVEVATGTRVEVSSLTRATAATGCTSTGYFEDWLLARIGVGSAAPVAVTSPVRAR